jgi:hypothetical protein
MKNAHIIDKKTHYYKGYGDVTLEEQVDHCSCGLWFFRPEEMLRHQVEVLWQERQKQEAQ